MNIKKSDIKHIFFDLDNTLWDFKKNSENTLIQIFNEFGLRQEFHNFLIFHHIYKHHNQKMWIAYNQGNITKEELITKRFHLTLKEKGIDDKELALDMGEAYLELSAYQTILFPGTKEILQYLKEKNYHCHIITNGFIKVQSKKIDNCGLTDFFDTLTFSEEAGCSKPNKKIFELALNKAKAELSESIMVGDDINTDIKGAINLNMRAIHIHTSQEEIHENHIVIPNLKQIFDIL